jgi:hypothetical protein
MTMDRLSLARFLELLQLPHARRLKVIERDARKAVFADRFGKSSDGGDFYGPFWSDAKRSAVEREFSLAAATADRIARNKSRRRLYPQLLRGFEQGWRGLRTSRITAATLELVTRLSVTIKGSEEEDYIHASNVLAVKEPRGVLHIAYPYFSKDVGLGVRHAKVGVRVLRQGFARAKPESVAMLDVLRGNLFVGADGEVDTSARDELVDRYDAVMREWRAQKRIMLR